VDGYRLSAARRELLRSLAAEIAAAAGEGPSLVAVDGVDGAGKTVFADQLAAELEAGLAGTGRTVVRASADDFHHPRAVRYRRGRQSPDGFWLDSYDYPRMRAELLDPLRAGRGRFRTAAHDLNSDLPVDEPARPVLAGTVLVLDGIFLHRDELLGYWTYSVFLDVPFAVSATRMAARDGTPADPDDPALARYVGGQLRYLAACRPRQRATAVIDHADLDAPRRIAR